MLSPGHISKAGFSEHRNGKRRTSSVLVLLNGKPVTSGTERLSGVLSCPCAVRASWDLRLCPECTVIVGNLQMPPGGGTGPK